MNCNAFRTILLFLFLYTLPAFALDSLNVRRTYNRWAPYAVDISIQGNYAFTAEGYRGIGVYDLSNRDAPIEIGRVRVEAFAIRLKAFDTLLIASNWGQTKLFDIRLASAPVEIPTSLPDEIVTYTIQGRYLYCIYRPYNGMLGWGERIQQYLRIYDLQNVSVPVLVSEHSLGISRFSDIAIRDSILFVESDGELIIFNISQRDRPRIISQTELNYQFNGYHKTILLRGNQLFFQANSISCWDISNLYHPTYRYEIAHHTFAFTNCYLSGECLTAVTRSDAIQYDISDPNRARGTENWTFESDGESLMGVVSIDEWVYIASGAGGLQVRKRGQIPNTLHFARSLQPGRGLLIDHYLYDFANHYLMIYPILRDSMLGTAILTGIQTGEYYSVKLINQSLLMCDHNSIYLYNVSNPARPVSVGIAGIIPNQVKAFSYSDSTLYTFENINNTYKLRVYGASDIRNLIMLGETNLQGVPISEYGIPYLYSSMGIAYLLTFIDGNEYLTVIDASTISQTRVVSSSQFTGYGWVFSGQFGFTVWESGINVYDVSDPGQILFKNRYQANWHASELAIYGDRMYVGSSYGVRILDISNPLEITEIGFYDDEKNYHAPMVQGEYIYTSGTQRHAIYRLNFPESGVAEAPITVSTTTTLGLCYPSPFNSATIVPYKLERAGVVSLKLYDMTGREVRTLVDQRQAAGEYSVRVEGSGLGSGTYFVRLRAGETVQSRKIVLVK